MVEHYSKLFKRVKWTRYGPTQLLEYHADAKERECPECHGRARLADGRWCQSCNMTGIVGGSLPA
jgi:hypothetical protein